ncbi:fluoride efflux transporter CrcB [Streptomyces sp. MAR4 CNX-425]|uniref:fluoride efflux transporter CrcB n=1 Tax=Streptomyces sp. MAR4 CNX-425 TaxID=3406343 RepID=UPI003B5048FD
MNLLLVIAGGMAGAPLRYVADRAVQLRLGSAFPWGTLAVNVAGCLILGTLTGATLAGAAPESVQMLLGTGLCGALTTYSTLSYETLRLAETARGRAAAAYVGVSLAAGLGAAVLGAGLGAEVRG